MKKVFEFVILPLAIIYVAYLIITGTAQPINFDKQKGLREDVAIERLKDIRTLQEAFKSRYGRYTGSFDTLINFYKADSLIVKMQIGSFDDSLAVAEGRVYVKELKLAVKDTLLKGAKLSVDSLRYIPFGGGDTILMQAVIANVSGLNVPLFEAAIPYNTLLRSMGEEYKQLIINLNAERKKIERYQGLKVGDVVTPNNNVGNWE